MLDRSPEFLGEDQTGK